MQLLALLPLLAVLVSETAAVPTHRQHRALAARRTIKLSLNKRGQVCRVRTSSTTAAAAASTSADAAASSDAASSSAVASEAAPTTSVVGQQAAAQPTSSAAAASSEAAAPASSEAAAASSTTSSAAAATSSASSNSGSNSGSLTPNGKKAGISAGDALAAMGSHIGWWYNWAPTEEGTSSSSVQFVPMLWGDGSATSTDASRLASFQTLSGTPTWIIGPEEPDCAAGDMSAGMSIDETASLWNTYLAPYGEKGSLLLSPSMCKQLDEDGWLATFQTKISRDFDITNLHINKNSMAGVQADLDYYWNKYQKPMWVTEFACVDDANGFTPCTDQSQINSFISSIVDLFESDSRVYGYAYSNGYGLGSVWPMWSNGALSESGQTYLSAVSKYY